MLPLERWFGELPIFIRVLAAGVAGLFAWLAWRYWDILDGSGEPTGSTERVDYDALLAELGSGGTPAKVYRNWLTQALDRVDVFFGDSGRNDKSLFARALTLETPGARWTARAFDQCLLLALIYPIATILAVWIWTAHAGGAERILGFWETPSEDSAGGLLRWTFGLSMLIGIYGAWRFPRADGLPEFLWLGAIACAIGMAYLSTLAAGASIRAASGGGLAIVIALTSFMLGRWIALSLGALAVALVVVLPAAALIFSPREAFKSALDMVLAVAVVGPTAAISIWSIKIDRQGAFLSLFFPTAILATFASVWFLSASYDWPVFGPPLLIFGLLTLVNAPFDWFAIGLTRALPRRGLAPGGRGPFFYAAVDALVAAPVIAFLAFVTVFTVQTFEDIAVLRGGANAETLPLGPLFEGLETRLGNPEFWWVWLMLFSTLIPSAFNLCVAAASLIRGLPFLNTWIVKRLQMAGAMRDSDRLLVASALSAQIAGGFLATGVALYLIGVWFLPIWLPFLGSYVRDFSEALAAYNAPARIMTWFAGAQ
jgi:hypothetical protein